MRFDPIDRIPRDLPQPSARLDLSDDLPEDLNELAEQLELDANYLTTVYPPDPRILVGPSENGLRQSVDSSRTIFDRAGAGENLRFARDLPSDAPNRALRTDHHRSLSQRLRSHTTWVSACGLVVAVLVGVTVMMDRYASQSPSLDSPIQPQGVVAREVANETGNSVEHAFDGSDGLSGMIVQTSELASIPQHEFGDGSGLGIIRSGTEVTSLDERLNEVQGQTSIPEFLMDASQPEVEAWLDLLDSRHSAAVSVSF